MSDRKDLAWTRSMALLRPISLVLKRELPLCGARCRDGHACRAKAAWDGIEPYDGRRRLHGGLSTGPRTQEGRDRLSAATKKMWTEHREERRASISAGMRRYRDAVRQCEVTKNICARVMGSHPDILKKQAECNSNELLPDPRTLSRGSNELLPDTRAPGAAVGSDPAMATLGTFDRAKVRRV